MSFKPRSPYSVVLAAGAAPRGAAVPDLKHPPVHVIAADGGLVHAQQLGLQPDLLVGDLDSVAPELLARYPDLPIARHPRDKDELDLELAIAVAGVGPNHALCIVGAFGGRLDHSLAALFIAAKHAEHGVHVALFGESHEAHLLTAACHGPQFTRQLPLATTVSLLALTAACSVTTTGVAYPLSRADLAFGSGLGTSNITIEPLLSVTVHSGTVAVIIEHPEP